MLFESGQEAIKFDPEIVLGFFAIALSARGTFLRAELLAACDLEPIRRAPIAARNARHEISEDGAVFEQMPRASSGEQDFLMVGMPIHDEMGVGRQDDLVEL